MKITNAHIKNFRLLKDIDIKLEQTMSVIVGKNNTGKTSLLKAMNCFINDRQPSFCFEDFSIETQNAILELGANGEPKKNVDTYVQQTISLKITIEYNDKDNISEASAFIMDLDDMSNKLILLFQFGLSFEDYERLMCDFDKAKATDATLLFGDFVRENLKDYFKKTIYAVDSTNESNRREVENTDVGKILAMEIIGARRDVDNNGQSHTLADLASKHYTENKKNDSDNAYPELRKLIRDTDIKLTNAYKPIFSSIVEDIKKMSYNDKEAEIEVMSRLNEDGLFNGNTTVTYKHDETSLPEDYNGLGYLNLFAVIFYIRIKINSLANSKALIKILFIEEPEAHTHPQMQYVFIQNIESILKKYATDSSITLQTIISSHSPQIVSQCDFNSIKYFRRESTTNETKSLNLSDLKNRIVNSENEDEKTQQNTIYRFIKKYITLDKAELFFADKAILIEGDTERILMSAMMEKIDNEHHEEAEYNKSGRLLSQNISILEVGAFSQHFKELIDFLGIEKTLIVTDLDTVNGEGKAVAVADASATKTSNTSLKTFFAGKELVDIKSFNETEKILSSNDYGRTWSPTKDGILRIAYQKEENGYTARSFEDAFLSVNMQFVADNKEKFEGLKCRDQLESDSTKYYKLAENCVDKKTAFALDILLNGGENNNEWKIPEYIKEGLEWIQK